MSAIESNVMILEWFEPEQLSRTSSLPTEFPPGRRTARRVRAKLRVAIHSRHCDFMAVSADISESGLLIANYYGPHLRKGSMVDVMIRGVVSDNSNESEYRRMVVERVSGSNIALSFDRSHSHAM